MATFFVVARPPTAEDYDGYEIRSEVGYFAETKEEAVKKFKDGVQAEVEDIDAFYEGGGEDYPVTIDGVVVFGPYEGAQNEGS